MMVEKNEMDKEEEEMMMPGFRFHPTDEELVEFYLKRRIQQKPLSVELITQLDIYKYDPWDLPKLAGEKEWYFFCPRDCKYRNSSRPNRLTKAGFWKATGTDRPIYSSEGIKCIGLKKSLVFYIGRAAKGTKTDWMMHEYRLPSPKPSDNNFLINDSWAICRIYKKKKKRAVLESWESPLKKSSLSQRFTFVDAINSSDFALENVSCSRNGLEKQLSFESYSPLEIFDFKSFDLINSKSEMDATFMLSPQGTLVSFSSCVDFGQQKPFT